MAVTGDFEKLARIKRQLAAVKSKKLHREVSRQLAHEALTLIADGFRAETDPYGSAWAGLKRRTGRILQDTGRLRNSFTVREITASGFRIGSAVQYAAFHQRGNPRLPRRMMVPRAKRMPRDWARGFHKTAAEVIRAHFGH